MEYTYALIKKRKYGIATLNVGEMEIKKYWSNVEHSITNASNLEDVVAKRKRSCPGGAKLSMKVVNGVLFERNYSNKKLKL
ncbi:hypothetical protein VYA_15020 [Vibrio alfacsensis]|nr:hypothetical protein VYA_15020 [Vibrio alfacsensis]